MKALHARILMLAGLLLGAYAAVPRSAQAHASLVKCNIAKNAALAAAPKTLTCTFAEGIKPKGSFIGVFEAAGDGAEIDNANSTVSFTNAHQIGLALPKLAKGAYIVMWYTISADDGHRAGGAFSFRIK